MQPPHPGRSSGELGVGWEHFPKVESISPWLVWTVGMQRVRGRSRERVSCPEPLVSTHFSVSSAVPETCSRPRLCRKLPESLFLPPCSLQWSVPAWSQARNSHYCLTRKAASSAEGGNPLPGTPCSHHCQLSGCLSTCLPLHASLLTWVSEGLGVQMWLLEGEDTELLFCQTQAQPSKRTMSANGK